MNGNQTIFAVLVSVILAFLVVDCSGGTTRHLECTVLRHEYHPSWVETDIDSDGNVTCTHHPEEFYLICVEAGSKRQVSVSSRTEYDLRHDGEQVTVRARIGWISGINYIPKVID
jgi:hypothetical protein